ncbi:MAG TPA: hypothetical protein VM802_29470 [Chitinophaga sp.]|uniref:hypothetical protein n=1 Tax=Chitinophaga sp. TaxID=1869181 RepID=UPI002CC11047|nr:hypothetical protein [Chitinophaga sp.]HVI49032.1 hypothetical protein [Chitinophaga sp.]
MKKALLIIFAGIVAGVTLIVFFKQAPGRAAAVHEKATQYSFNVTFDSTVPYKLDASASPAALCSFAWNEFFALNWKSSYTTVHRYRGYADPQWTYSSDKNLFPNAPLVWETYPHRVELRPNNDNMQPFDTDPNYVYDTTIPPKDGSVNQHLFHNLDENNEIGSCNLYAKILPDYNTNTQVLYEAKVNRDEYNYKYFNYRKEEALKRAVMNTARNIAGTNQYYPGGSSCNCPAEAFVFCLPCGNARVPGTGAVYTGALEVKAAWREVTDAEALTHLTRTIIAYEKLPNGVTVAVNKRYGLIGLHIIHKLANFPDFTFATFEHVDVDTKDNMGFIRNKFRDSVFPSIPQLYKRPRPIPDVVAASTDYVHGQLKGKNPNSVWLNYRLVGVQGNPSDNSSAFSFYLANYVIESDPPLANFRGSGIDSPYNGGVNLIYKGKRLSQGGCQGCHGVAQRGGSDFSFLMGIPDQPHKRPDISRTGSKLEAFIKGFRDIDNAVQRKGKR